MNVLLVGAIAFYVLRENSMARAIFQESERVRMHDSRESRSQLTREILDPELQSVLARIEREVTQLIQARFSMSVQDQEQQFRLRRAFWGMSLWDDPVLRLHVARAVLIHQPDNTTRVSYFNVRSDLVVPYVRDDREPGHMVETSLVRDDVVWRGNRIAGPLTVLGAHWGGYYLQLHRPPGAILSLADAPASESLLLILLLLVPGLVFLFGFTWRLISTRLLEPVEDLGRVARRAGRGDYSRRLVLPPDREDEIARVMAVFNRMLGLVEEYRDEMEDKVREATDEIGRKNRELMLGQRLAATGTLASGIAHEINNPLGGMLNVARRLEREDLTPDQRGRYIEILEEGIERIGEIVKKVLAVSPRKMTPTPLKLEEVIGRSIDLVQHRATRKGVTIECEFASPLPEVLGESNEIGQVFLNLLINAVDACEEQGEKVMVRATVHGEQVMVEIEDDGIGMAPHVAERAFDMFFTTKEAGEGTGLGLATVHSLVQAHGGSLDLKTAPGTGTTVCVRLPFMSDDVSDA
ncbi:MAG: HAMP domain-containing protein [Planctomycetes bacterium]|nr:HAMP domain-containing protein [Planctomycetota bacterium]